MRRLRQAVTFLTRVPIGVDPEADLRGVSGWFPVVGALVGLAIAGVYAVLYPWMPSTLSASIAVLAGVLLTGAFHEDGLADSFDAIGSGARGAKALDIMRDSRLGTYGVAALTGSVLLRVVAVASMSPALAVAGLIAAHSIGRAGSVVVMATTAPARADGLGRSGLTGASSSDAVFAVVTGLVITAVTLEWWSVAAILVVGLGSVAVRSLGIRRVGGMTGDLLGATEQLGEASVLVLVAVAGWQGWLPWWSG